MSWAPVTDVIAALRTLAQTQVAKVRGHRVVTYNLLSPDLGEPAHFPRNAAADLDPPTRLARIRARLSEHMGWRRARCSACRR